LKSHAGAARDVLAMTSTDISRFGGLPAVFYNVLDVRSLGEKGSESFDLFVSALAELIKAANEQGIVVHKGETAELGACIGSDNPEATAPFNWAGFALGIYSPNKMIYGDNVRLGDAVVALREHGFRSNGISSVRKAFQLAYGDGFYSNPEAQYDLRSAAAPSILYDKFLTTANGWYDLDFHPMFDVGLIAHLSGGGIGKFAELLAPTGFSAELEDLWDLPPIMRKCADWREMDDHEVYRTWNGGQGVLAVVTANQAEDFVDFAGCYNIEAKICGRITSAETSTVTVKSKYNGKTLTF
jgi:phosphoribosylformylglycinamidine cyclo-ligase